MDQDPENARALAYKYETVFCIFLAVTAYLGRENAEPVRPVILYLLLALLSLNLSAILALRLWPSKERLSAPIILANCCVITGMVSCSGGPGSNLWVLYLLPIYTASLLLDGKKAFSITAGIMGFNSVFYVVSFEAWNPDVIFAFCVKNGFLVFSSALTWRLASAERRSFAKLRRQREELDRLGKKINVRTARDERMEKLAEVGLISAGIVHDLKNPLMVIRGFADLCLQEESLGAGPRKDIESIRRTTSLCQEMVAGILKAARKDELPCASVEIHDSIESAIALCGNAVKKSGMTLERRYDPHPLHVLAPLEHLERIFLILLGRAAKAMPAGGTLTIRTRTDRRKDGRSRVQVIVEDDGEGVSDEALEKLFKPFGETAPPEEGADLGLYLCRDIALKYGGGLRAENAPARGAKFILSLPLGTAISEPPANTPVTGLADVIAGRG